MRNVPILDVADVLASGPTEFAGTKRYFATADVNGADLLDGVEVNFTDRPTRANLVAEHGDVLFAKMQATDKVVHVNGRVADAIFSTGFFNLRPRQDILESRFLFWLLRSPQFHLEKDKRCTGATQKALTLSGLRDISIPSLPPLEEQRRLATILDKADAVRRKRSLSLKYVDDLIKSEFVFRFGSAATNLKNLPTSPIKSFGKVVTGNTPPRKDSSNFGQDVEWIKSDNINTPSHFLTQADEWLSATGKRIGRTAPVGSTLVTCIAGSPSVIGNAALADREVAFNQQINAVVPNRETDPYFLYCQFLVSKNLVQANSTDSMKGMVSKGKFQEIEFLRPPLDEQRDFGRFFSRMMSLRLRLEESRKDGEALFGSLASRALHGEL
ncbi:restriction endonuclease subunit S [Bombella sp. ESL0380]|uniref:restriction endonuclease subunit S n=1 Tax=Bombella sp. ESL0380 TaxID=2676444 RepID=UPI000A3B6606|nr:restriction endonuclease subunit S [Bombella sp. ESL0380]